MDGSTYRDLLKPIFGERRVILVGGVVAAWTATVPLVRGLGATDVLVIGTEGTGDRFRTRPRRPCSPCVLRRPPRFWTAFMPVSRDCGTRQPSSSTPCGASIRAVTPW